MLSHSINLMTPENVRNNREKTIENNCHDTTANKIAATQATNKTIVKRKLQHKNNLKNFLRFFFFKLLLKIFL